MKKHILIKTIAIYFLLSVGGIAAQSNYFEEGIKLYQKSQLEKSKLLFEKDIVFNPKNEKSYLYLAKIYKKKNNDQEEEINLNNVLLLNPKNDEALYMLALLRVKQSNYAQAKELMDQFVLVCDSFCSKKKEIEDKLKKITPEDAKNND